MRKLLDRRPLRTTIELTADDMERVVEMGLRELLLQRGDYEGGGEGRFGYGVVKVSQVDHGRKFRITCRLLRELKEKELEDIG